MKNKLRTLATGATIGTALLGLAGLAAPSAVACTGLTIKPQDGSIIFARTMEFACDLRSNVIVVPRGQEFVGTAPGDKPGLRWTNHYAIVGANGFNMPVTVEGLNEQGLSVGLFYFPGFAKYETVAAADFGRVVAPWELGFFLLGTCANVEEAVAAARSVRVAEVVQREMGFVPPVHFIVTDAQGRSVVLEPIDGTLKVHVNPLGVMSNSPSFDWHMTNLSNYLALSTKNAQPLDLAGNEIRALGQGSGMLGLPGDFTPPSRFVRAVAFSASALPVETAHLGVLQAFHLLNQFDIPRGAARGTDHGHEVSDYTLWTSAADLQNLRFYFRTFDNSRIRMVDLKTAVAGAQQIQTISMQGDEQIEDLSHTAR